MPTTAELVERLRNEALELAEYSQHRADVHGRAWRGWRRVSIVLGAPAAAIAGVSGAFAFTDHTTTAGSLAIAAAVSAALATYLRTSQLVDGHLSARSGYNALRTDAMFFADIELDRFQHEEEAVAALRGFIDRKNELDSVGPPPDRLIPGRSFAALVALALILTAAIVVALVWDRGGGAGPSESPTGLGGDGDPTEEKRAEEDAALARRFAPILRLSANELFHPIERGAYVQATEVIRKSPDQPVDVVLPGPTLETLPQRRACGAVAPCRYFLRVIGLRPKQGPPAYNALQARLFPVGDESVVYWHVVRYDSGEAAVQYWLFYVFNAFQNWHEADWEQLTVRIDDDGDPRRALYSAHEGGNVRAWEEMRKVGEHPVVFPARGSHANYFVPGKHVVQVECRPGTLRGRLCRSATRAFVRDIADGCGRLLEPPETVSIAPVVLTECKERGHSPKPPLRYRLEELRAPVFPGYYGFGNFLVNGRIPVGEEGPNEPQRRDEWRDPLAAT